MHRCPLQFPLAFVSLLLLISSEAISYSLKKPSVQENLAFKSNLVHKSIAYPLSLYDTKEVEGDIFNPDKNGGIPSNSQESYYGELRLSPLMDSILYPKEVKDQGLERWNPDSSSDSRYMYKKKGDEERALNSQDIDDYIKLQRAMDQTVDNLPIHGLHLKRSKDTSRKRLVNIYDILDESPEDTHQAEKRQGPSLSIVNPLDVLRQRYLLEMARRRMKVNQNQIQANAELLKNLGKRKKRNSTKLAKKKMEAPRWQDYSTRQHKKQIQVTRSDSA